MSRSVNQKGFTLLELLIATTIFSTILLLCTFGLINVGNIYYKGLITSRTQNATRNVMDTLSQSIQFGGSNLRVIPSAPAEDPITHVRKLVDSSSIDKSGAICVGDTRIQYNRSTQVSDTEWALKTDKSTTCSVDGRAGKELLGDGMQITKLDITEVNGDYTITLNVAHAKTTELDSDNCKGGADSKYCASVNLTTTVHRRVE